MRAVSLFLIMCTAAAQASDSFALLSAMLSRVESLECEVVMTTISSRESAPGDQIPDLVVDAAWFKGGRYSYRIMSRENGAESEFRCVFDGNRFLTVSRGEKSMLTTGSGDKRFHAAAMAGITPLFEPLRYLRPTDKELTIIENSLKAVANPLALPVSEESIGLRLLSGQATASVDFQAKDGTGRYLVHLDQKRLFPWKTELVDALTSNLLSSCEVTSFESVEIEKDRSVDFPKTMTIKNYNDGKPIEEIEVTLKRLKINSPTAQSRLDIDQSKMSYFGDSDSNTIIPVGR